MTEMTECPTESSHGRAQTRARRRCRHPPHEQRRQKQEQEKSPLKVHFAGPSNNVGVDIDQAGLVLGMREKLSALLILRLSAIS